MPYKAFTQTHKAIRAKNGFSKEDDKAVVLVDYANTLALCEWLSWKKGKLYRLPKSRVGEFRTHNLQNLSN